MQTLILIHQHLAASARLVRSRRRKVRRHALHVRQGRRTWTRIPRPHVRCAQPARTLLRQAWSAPHAQWAKQIWTAIQARRVRCVRLGRTAARKGPQSAASAGLATSLMASRALSAPLGCTMMMRTLRPHVLTVTLARSPRQPPAKAVRPAQPTKTPSLRQPAMHATQASTRRQDRPHAQRAQLAMRTRTAILQQCARAVLRAHIRLRWRLFARYVPRATSIMTLIQRHLVMLSHLSYLNARACSLDRTSGL